jgi:hypothetical protein
MRKMMVLLALSTSVCLAQTIVPIPVFFFPPELKQYLALSDDQVAKISTLNSQLNSFRASKFERQIQVQSEIAEWTAKENLDSLALGLRYAELEAIRRELDDQQKKTVSQIQALLTVDQKAKLATLQQALTLYSTACSGVSQNLLNLPIPSSGNAIQIDRWFDTTSFFAPCGGSTSFVRTGVIGGVLLGPP